MVRMPMRGVSFVLSVCMLLLLLCPLCSAAQPTELSQEMVAQATRIADGILSARMKADGADTLQAWADEALPDMIGVGGEWYALALHQRDAALDLSVYSTALQTYLRERGEGEDGAVTQQRYALTLLAVGGGDSYLERIAQTTVGAMGHMSYVYGLHLAHLGLQTAISEQDMVAVLLDAQGADGGWSLTGKDRASDVDVTAMTLQALARHREEADVAAAAERAWTFLSQAQSAGGDFYSYGVLCPESGAQVIVALCAWGIPVDDARFVKDGVTLLDGILQYQLDNGCFSHTSGGKENVTATVQTLYAMVAIERAVDGRGSLYEIERPAGGVDLMQREDGVLRLDLSQIGIKVWIAIGVVFAALIACFVLLMQGKRSAKHYLSIAVLVAVALAAVCLIDIQTADDYYGKQPQIKEHPVGSVTLTIRCDTVAGRDGAAHLPADGVMLPETVFVIEAGETVFDILSEAAVQNGLRVQNTGVTATSSALAYISAINDLHEYDFGDLSGWMYFVNGVSPSVGCGEYLLSDGDVIEFLYSCDLGEDLKNE